MIIRTAGFIAMILVVLSLLDYFGMIQITATPLKHLAEALIRLGKAAQEGVQSF